MNLTPVVATVRLFTARLWWGLRWVGPFMGRLADRMGIMIPALIGSFALPAGFYLAAHASSILQISLAFSFCVGF
ncbi:MAG: hypothetical protein CM1200mP18_19110 [Gammaproteobacteria bacterium]|nr:MAG: hypothetical protein CM1200mP18_19110 [Gammaproteobacteria bacterium]